MKGRGLLLTAGVLAMLPVWDLAQPGDMTQASSAGGDLLAPQAELSGPQQRALERRREREAEREWITVPEVSAEDLRDLLDKPDLAVLDVTCQERGAKIPDRIPGAVWRDCTRVEEWAHEYRLDQTIVVYCA